jgi:hypothetical protein
MTGGSHTISIIDNVRDVVGKAFLPNFLSGAGVEAKKGFLDVLGWVLSELAIPKNEQFAVSNDGSTRAVKIIFPQLGVRARCPSVGKIGFVGGAILIRTTPVEPAGDIGEGGRG